MAETEPSDPRVGSVVQERYRVTEVLSAGGMGVVYRGERLGLGRQVAIKFLHAAYSTQSDFVKRFEREARLMSRLEHPNIVSVIDFGVADSPYIVMDFVSGHTLGELLEQGPVPWRRAAGIARQILAGLAHAHQRGIIHRDIKSANVMLREAEGAGDHVQLLDFGLAKLRDADQSMSQIVVGTPSYMSPEQAAGKKADGRSDIYSTGIILYELLAGTKPFVSEEPLALLQMHMNEEPPPLSERDAAAPAALEAVVRRAMAKDPGERYQNPAEMQQALDEVLSDPDREPSRPVPAAKPAAAAVPEPARAPRRRRTASERPRTAPARRATAAPRRGGTILWLVPLAAGVALWWSLGRPGLDYARGGVHPILERASISSVTSASAPSLERAEALAEAGDRELAIRMIHRLIRAHPRDVRATRRLGDLYFEKGWWSEGLAAYAKALELRPALARDRLIAANVIHALERSETEERARALLVSRLGRAALKPLRAAARRDPARRRQMQSVIREISSR